MKITSFVACLTLLAACAPSPQNLRQPDPVSKPLPVVSASASPLVAAPAPLPTGKRPLSALPYTPGLDLASMDASVDPCTDFYKYSCGGWMKNNPIPADQSSWSVYGKLADENLQYLWGILEDAAKPVATRDVVQQKIGDYFASCMDTESVEKSGLAPLQPALAELAAVKTVGDLPAVLARMHLRAKPSHGGDPMFQFTSGQDFGDASKVIAFAYAAGLGLPDRDYYVKTDAKSQETRDKYLQHLQRMFLLLGEIPSDSQQHAQIVMAIETDLAKASLTRVDKRDPHKLHHKMTVAKLQALTPDFSWSAYLSALGAGDVKELNVTEPKFFQELGRQLKTRDLAAWTAYLRWQLVRARAPYLSAAFEQASFDFYRKYLRGVTEQQPRWKKCVNWLDRDLGEALGQEFVRRTFTAETRQRTVRMTEWIEKAMEQDIQSLTWMSPATKKQALAKLHAIRNKVGYPDKWRDYGTLSVVRGDFSGNIERSMEFESRRQLAKIGKPLDRGEWGMTPPTVNAYYDPQMNDINFPAGVLQPPLFDPKMEDAPNYGNTGATIGHELTHGFDDEGRQFDARGDLKDWWTKQDAKEFEKRTACIKEQYAQYVVVDEIHINSALTLGEDVADLGGTILAWMAWKSATQGMTLSPVDGLSPEQRFFVGMAQWACTNERPEDLRLHAATDPHSPGRFRINGVVSNMPEFWKAFQCKPGQPMVRQQVCRVW
ncbi:MAG: M13 family metallopeptidase [Deltaproteobacteria bacterium]|nr:M13 family metallopeptidase [Deltaproteobacteria bacterium]